MSVRMHTRTNILVGPEVAVTADVTTQCSLIRGSKRQSVFRVSNIQLFLINWLAHAHTNGVKLLVLDKSD